MTSRLLLNPRLPAVEFEELRALQSRLDVYPNHLWLLSSGSSSVVGQSNKLIGLSRHALETSSAAVNRHLASTAADVWGAILPDYHVGGLQIQIRASLSGARVVDFTVMLADSKFNQIVHDFCLRLFNDKITMLSLVPTQVFDIVDQEIPAPPSLRAVIIGGAALSDELYRKARALGWPLLPSFGMTECCSQIATAELATLNASETPALRILEHCQVETREEFGVPDLLVLKSESLLTGFFQKINGVWEFTDPKKDGALLTQDRVRLHGRHWLQALGRVTDFVKVKGEGVDLEGLRSRFFEAWSLSEREHAAIVDIPDARDGAKLVLVTEKSMDLSLMEQRQRLQAWNISAFPPERLQAVDPLDALPRTELGKIAWARLRAVLQQNARSGG